MTPLCIPGAFVHCCTFCVLRARACTNYVRFTHELPVQLTRENAQFRACARFALTRWREAARRACRGARAPSGFSANLAQERACARGVTLTCARCIRSCARDTREACVASSVARELQRVRMTHASPMRCAACGSAAASGLRPEAPRLLPRLGLRSASGAYSLGAAPRLTS